MKNIIKLTLLIIATLQLNITLAQQRNTLWMRGVSQTSNGWNATKVHLAYLGYDFENRIFSNVYNPGLGVEAAADELVGTFGEHNDLLGIAHDYGGLVLRDLQHKVDKISAMILVGTPNQGSSALGFATTVEPGSDGTRAQKLINAIQDIQAGDRCNDCDLAKAFETWVNGLYGGRNYLCDAKNGSDVIDRLNENMPTVPFAVMWGSVEDFSIPRLLSSRAFPSDGDYYTACYADQIELARQKAKDAYLLSFIRNTTGLLGGVLNLIGGFLPGSSPAELIRRISSFISGQRQNFINQIQAVRQRDEVLAQLLRCEFANQLLAAEWQLAILENSALELQEVTISIDSEYDDCMYDCGVDMAWDDWGYDMSCEEYCAGLSDEDSMVVTIIIAEENDGLLTKSEQLLDGATKTYHLEETNHFQESRADLKPVISDAFEDLFQGGAGAAFIVPQ